MTSMIPYTSSIKDMPLMYPEMRRTARLLCEGKTSEEILVLSMSENIYQLKREKRRNDVPRRMCKRLSLLAPSLLAVVAHGSDRDARLIALLALLKADGLFFAYMQEVYAPRLRSCRNDITDVDDIAFMERKQQQSDVVARWSNASLVRVCRTYRTILCEVGLASRDQHRLFIHKPYIDPSIRGMLGDDDIPYAKAMMLEE